MDKLMYMMMIEKTKTYNKITKKVVEEHVENIRRLDDEGKLEICGRRNGGFITRRFLLFLIFLFFLSYL